MLERYQRHSRGASLLLSVILTLVILVVGVGVFFLLREFSGSRELENATDAGNLNVAKQALTSPSITLSGDLETSNFGGLTDAAGTVDLLNYNRIFGQTLLVVINAQAEGTPQAQQNATTLISAVYSPSSSISQRLNDRLSLWSYSSKNFENVALSNSTRMLPNSSVNGLGANFQAAYVDKGQPTNLYLDPKILPAEAKLPDGILSDVKSPNGGAPYIKGYTDIALSDGKLGQLPAIAGATVNPLQQPHLISQSTFHSSTNIPVQAGTVPPNSFQSAAQVQANVGNGLTNYSCGEVGSLTTDFPASIPRGYIIVKNLPGVTMNGVDIPSNQSIFNNQLFTGIFVANNGVFSTDESQILAWAAYNAGGHVGPAPSTAGMFDVNGNPVSGQQNQVTALGGNGYPTMADYTNVEGPNANPAAASMLTAFEAAYPAPSSTGSTVGNLTAVEDLKAQVISAFVNASDNQLSAFTPTNIPTTGMRVFDHTKAYPAIAGGSPQFTTPGNVAQLCAQADPKGTAVENCKKIKQRLREINPKVTDDEMNTLLGLDASGTKPATSGAQTIELGQTYYIYMQNNKFVMTQTAPPWVSAAATPDGDPEMDSVVFSTIGLSVDPVGEEGFNQTLWADQPDPNSAYLGTDEATWQPSSGFNNLLGQLTFGELVSPVSFTITSSVPLNAGPAGGAPGQAGGTTGSPTPGIAGWVYDIAQSTTEASLQNVGGSGCSASRDQTTLTVISAAVLQVLENDMALTNYTEAPDTAAATSDSLALYNGSSSTSSSTTVTSLSIVSINMSGGYATANYVVTLSDGCSTGAFNITN